MAGGEEPRWGEEARRAGRCRRPWAAVGGRRPPNPGEAGVPCGP